jgi:hypothetical protein
MVINLAANYTHPPPREAIQCDTRKFHARTTRFIHHGDVSRERFKQAVFSENYFVR